MKRMKRPVRVRGVEVVVPPAFEEAISDLLDVFGRAVQAKRAVETGRVGIGVRVTRRGVRVQVEEDLWR